MKEKETGQKYDKTGLKFEETDEQIEIYKVFEKSGNWLEVKGNRPKMWGNRSKKKEVTIRIEAFSCPHGGGPDGVIIWIMHDFDLLYPKWDLGMLFWRYLIFKFKHVDDNISHFGIFLISWLFRFPFITCFAIEEKRMNKI